MTVLVIVDLVRYLGDLFDNRDLYVEYRTLVDPTGVEEELDGTLHTGITKIDAIRLFFADHAEDFRRNINVLSQPFLDACNSASKKMLSPELASELLSENRSGTLISGARAFLYHILSVDKNNGQVIFMSLSEKKEGLFLRFIYAVVFYEDTSNHLSFTSCLEKDRLSMHGLDENDLINVGISFPIAILNFIKYAAVETTHLPAGQKVKGIDCKYVNDTGSNITFIDSTWFTNLVKSDGFHVRGHFRLQPCGQGMKDRKLIWINDFEKEGYTAPARKLSHEQ